MNTLFFNFRFIILNAAIFLLSFTCFGQTFRSVEFINNNTCIAVCDGGKIYKSKDGGLSWYDAASAGSENINKLTVVNKDLLLAACSNGIIKRSFNAGETWTSSQAGMKANVNGICVTENGNGFAVGNNNLILSTKDFGLNWKRVSGESENSLNDVSLYGKNNGVIVGSNNFILYTTNGGLSWNHPSTSLSFNANLMHVKMTDRQTAFIISDQGQIIRSTDGGDSWILLFSNHGLSLNKLTQIDAGIIAAAGANGGVIISYDNGLTWNSQCSGTMNDLYCMSFIDTKTGLAGGDNETLIITHDGGITWNPSAFLPLTKTNPGENSSIKILGNFPNPFNPSTKISYLLQNDAEVNMNVYDVAGKEIAVLVTSFQKKGEHTVEFDAAKLSSGIYFYKIITQTQGQKFSKTMKMMLVK